MDKRAEILRAVEQIICRDRQGTHGAPENTFEVIACYWSLYLTKEMEKKVVIDASDVAIMMTLFKISRLQANPFHEDNILDGIGYLAIAGELISNVQGSDELLNDR
jgi:S-adenosylmethionine:diacylglycerol 3-amino-3-carboxypropyl transferase